MTVESHDEGHVLTMRELLVHHLQLARRGVRYWTRGAAVFALLFLAGMIWVVARPRVYKSEARFQVIESDAAAADQRNDEETARSVENRLSQVFNSRRYVLSITRQLHLYDHLAGRTSEQKIADLFAGSLDRRVERDIVSLGFTFNDPIRAREVVRALLHLFVNERKVAATERAQEALRNVEAQERELGTALAERQQALDRFVLDNQETVEQILRMRNPGARDAPSGAAPSLDHAGSRTQRLRARLQQLQRQLDLVLARGVDAPQVAAPGEPEAVTQERARVREAQERVQDLIARGMTPAHPTRVEAERRLHESQASLQRAIAQHSAASLGHGLPPGADRARRVEDLRREIDATRAELDESARADRASARGDTGAGRPRNRVEIEARYDRLSADLQTTRLSYGNVLQRLFEKQADLRRVELSGGESVRVLDPPSLPVEPEPPGRVKLAAIVTLLAALLGVVTAIVAGLLDTRVYDLGDLRRWGESPDLPFVPDLSA